MVTRRLVPARQPGRQRPAVNPGCTWHLPRLDPHGTSGRLFALLLVAVVPVALLADVVMMLLGHVVGGLALFGGSVLAAAIAVALAGVSGMRHLRKLVSPAQLPSRAAGRQPVHRRRRAGGGYYTNVVQLDRSEYTEVR